MYPLLPWKRNDAYISTLLNTKDADEIQKFNPFVELVQLQLLELKRAYPSVKIEAKNLPNNKMRFTTSKLDSTIGNLKSDLGLPAESNVMLEDYNVVLTKKDNHKKLFQVGFYNNIPISFGYIPLLSKLLDEKPDLSCEREVKKSRFLSREDADSMVLSSEQDSVDSSNEDDNTRKDIDAKIPITSSSPEEDMSGLDVQHAIPVDSIENEEPSKITENNTSNKPSAKIHKPSQPSNLSQKEELFTFRVKGTTLVYKLKKDETLAKIFEDTKGHGKPSTFKFNNFLIKPTDSPSSINAKSDSENLLEMVQDYEPKISFRLSSGNVELYFKIKEGIKLRKVFKRFIEANNLSSKRVSFYHKNNLINGNMTTTEIGLENNSVIFAQIQD